jgi:hypothetical protein
MQEESINLDDLDDIYEDTGTADPYIEDSAIIRCGRYMSMRAKNDAGKNLLASGLTSGDTTVAVVVDDLLPEQRKYIDLVSTGTPRVMACTMLNIDVYLPNLWEETLDKDGTYMQCMQLIRRKEADLLEEDVWKQAMDNPRSVILKMFALKSRKDEYKDNAAPTTNLQTNIHVTISDQQGNARPYVVDTGIQSEEIKRG